MKLLAILVAVLAVAQVNPACTLTLLSHSHCPHSQKLIKIIQKLQKNDQQPDIDKIQYRIVVEEKDPWEVSGPGTVYPTIWIDGPRGRTSYENEVSLVEIEYWLELQCRYRVPRCAGWMNQPIFPIRIDQPYPIQLQYENYTQFIDFLVARPVMKICQDPSLPTPEPSATATLTRLQSTIEQLLHQLPVFPKLTHNLRNYLLLNPQITAILLITDPRAAGQQILKDKFMDIIAYIRRRDPRIGYHIGEGARRDLIFVTDRLENMVVGRLLGFLGIDEEGVSDDGGIVAFRFVQSRNRAGSKTLQGLQYTIPASGILDNKFIFWLQQTALSSNSPKIHAKLFAPMPPICKSNTITGTYQPHNASSIVENVRLLKLIKELNGDQEEQQEWMGEMIFHRVMMLDGHEKWRGAVGLVLDQGETAYRFVHGFQYRETNLRLYSQAAPITLCLAHRQPLSFQTTQQLLATLVSRSLIRPKHQVAVETPQQL